MAGEGIASVDDQKGHTNILPNWLELLESIKKLNTSQVKLKRPEVELIHLTLINQIQEYQNPISHICLVGLNGHNTNTIYL